MDRNMKGDDFPSGYDGTFHTDDTTSAGAVVSAGWVQDVSGHVHQAPEVWYTNAQYQHDLQEQQLNLQAIAVSQPEFMAAAMKQVNIQQQQYQQPQQHQQHQQQQQHQQHQQHQQQQQPQQHQQHQQQQMYSNEYQQFQQGPRHLPQQPIQQVQQQFQISVGQPLPVQVSQTSLSSVQRRRKINTQPKRRTLTACESCRMKKVRCDLGKPTCGRCTKSGAPCVYRGKRQEPDLLTEMSGVAAKPKAPIWSTSNWFSKADGILKWPIFCDKYTMPQSNTLIAAKSEEGFPKLGTFSDDELQQMGIKLRRRVRDYITSYLENVANKSPIVDAAQLYRTATMIENVVDADPSINIFKLDMTKDNNTPLPLLMTICACGAMSKTLTLTNLTQYGTSLKEKEPFFQYAYKLFVVGAFLNSIPKYKIGDFDLNMVQFHMAQTHFWMYNLKPLKAWSSIFKASTLVMAIIESYKASGRKFTEEEHTMLERVFHCCVKYESELRVELSPSVPSSGIVNYPFPSIYPTPPLDGSMDSKDEAAWFFFLTEIMLRKFENRLMDDFYVPISVSSDESVPVGEFKGDNYILDWSRYTISEMITKCSVYVEELDKIEKSMLSHLAQIIPEEGDEIQPYGYVLQKASEQEATSRHKQHKQPEQTLQNPKQHTDLDLPSQQERNSTPSNRTKLESPESDSDDLQTFMEKRCGSIPEVVQFIKTRLIEVRLTMFRPLFYLVLHDTVSDYDSPFIEEVLHQGAESMDLLNVPLATHRHFGSWFYCKVVFTSVILVWGFYLRFRWKFFDKERLERFIMDGVTILEYWKDECTELKENLRILRQLIAELNE